MTVPESASPRGGPSRPAWAAGDVRVVLVAIPAAVLGVVGLALGWYWAPVADELFMTQKIFYFHAPLGIWTLLLTGVAAVAGACYLAIPSATADLLGETCMEVMVLGCGIVLVTGSLWAKPAWDDWFPWGEPRVTGMLVLFLIGIAYLVLRSSVDEPDLRARFSAVLALVGAVDALLAYFAIHVWNTMHPRVITGEGIAMDPKMKVAFYTCLLAMGLLVWSLVEVRFQAAALRRAVERVEDDAAALMGDPA